MNDFTTDDEWQRYKRDHILVPHFYEKRFAGQYQFIDQKGAIDTVVVSKGKRVTIDEKIVRWPKGDKAYTAFALETHSCTLPGLERDGWMKTGTADWLLYCFEMRNGDLDCFLIKFAELREWFTPLEELFSVFQKETRNRTRGRVVPIRDVVGDVPTKQFMLPNDQCEGCGGFGAFGYRQQDTVVLKWFCAEHRVGKFYADARRDVEQKKESVTSGPPPCEPFEHWCEVCGGFAYWGYGVRLRENKLGEWYCDQHRPDKERSAVNE